MFQKQLTYYINIISLYQRKILVIFILLLCTNSLFSNTPKIVMGIDATDSIFKGYMVNDKYQIWLDIDFYGNTVKVPDQDIFGSLPGVFGAVRDTRKWIITDAVIKGRKAYLSIINDYGSEDLDAELCLNSDGTYTLKKTKGSSIQIVVNRKWLKLPNSIEFKLIPKK